LKYVGALERELAYLSRCNSGGSAIASIRAVGLPLQLQQLLKGTFGIKCGQQMNLQRTLDSLRWVIERKALGIYVGNIRWQLEYIYNPDLQHYFLSKLKFVHNPTLLSVTTPTIGGKKVRILSQLRELGLLVGDVNRTLNLKQWPT
jgi:hypothetical protein